MKKIFLILLSFLLLILFSAAKPELGETHAQLKEKIIEEMLNYTEIVDLDFKGHITMDELKGIIREIRDDRFLSANYDGCNFNVQSGEKLSNIIIRFKYKRDEEAEKKIDIEIDRILQAASFNDSDYNKVRFIHDYIINNTKYTLGDGDELSNTYSIYSPEALLFGDGGVCQAYSMLFQRMANKLELDVEYITGRAWNSSVNESHSWNMVMIDELWYHIDVTWDDPVGVNMLTYNYFLKSDKHMEKNHSWESDIKADKNYK